MKEIQERLSEYGLTVELTEAARQWLAQQGFDPAFGARPLRRALQKYIESPLSVQMLRGEFKSRRCGQRGLRRGRRPHLPARRRPSRCRWTSQPRSRTRVGLARVGAFY